MELLSFIVLKNREGKRVFWATGKEMKSILMGTKTLMNITNIKVENEAGNVDINMFNITYLMRKWW